MKVITRAGWGARRPTGSYAPLPEARGTKVHYTGGYVSPKIVDDHDICLELMRNFQNQHINVNKWSDFAYNLAGCPHRRLLEGRGLRVMSAANGEGQNSGHYAILALVGSSGFVEPTDDLLHAVRDGIELLRKHGAGSEIKGHRDGYSTSCPGGPLYAWVRKGAPRPQEVPAKPKPVEKPVTVVWDGDVPRWPGRVLKHVEGAQMMRGEDVRVWQEKMARRGWTIDVDGWFGGQSAGVARGYRRGTGLPAGDTVDKATWAMTWSWTPPESA
ncbi:peptidoglycan recognition protein family protein [Streptosporangium sp. V21-05]|uniref:peptidoglycan recognition protein family protein n=1 Tax=Streptosporangium sp. V21-05 TaxID=3446115 RepID=UPI003F53403E